MPYDNLPPFPTVIEIIRTLAVAFDSKANNKTLDALAHEVDADYRKIKQLCEDVLLDPVGKDISPDLKQLLQECMNIFIKSYTETVSRISLDGIPRDQSLPLIIDHFFAPQIAQTLRAVHKIYGGPEPCLLVAHDAQALTTVLEWIAVHEAKRAEFLKGCTKEDRERLLAWSKGTDIPKLQSINLLPNWAVSPTPEGINWPRVKILLLIGRSIDWCRKLPLGKKLLASTLSELFTPVQPSAFEIKAREIQLINQSRLQPVWPIAEFLAYHLHGPATRKRHNKKELLQAVSKAKKILKQIDRHNSTGYWFDWREGSVHAHSHDLKKAVACYKNAFRDALYRAGENQRKIIEEALVLAASLEKPDKVFLKRLKSMAIMLGYDIPSVPEHSVDTRYKSSNIIEDWEIDLWRANFNRLFPLEGCFPGTSQHQTSSRTGPLFLGNLDDSKPNYGAPDRRIKVGNTWKKTYPQLVWFAEHSKTEIVQKLLQKGADVNCFSDAGDSPILMALEELNVLAVPYRSLDDRTFWLLAQHKHAPDTLNKCTLKKRLLPIISAVESGRPDIVDKVIDMGADPNGRGKTDNQTPLYVCLCLISRAKDPKVLQEVFDGPPTNATFDSIRRHMPGIAGFTLEDQGEFLEKSMCDPKFMAIKSAVVQLMVDRAKELLDVDKLRDIALQLIEAGANPNARHTNPIVNYTPLMLAAEFDEAEIFRIMLDHGGDPCLYYEHPRTGAKVNCFKIADEFQARRVQEILRLRT